MTFGTPALLALLVVLPVAVVAYVAVQRRRPRYTARFTNLNLLANVVSHQPGWRRYLPPALYVLALGALLTALAKPYATVKLPKQEGTVMLVMDVSGSMDARDVHPTRLAAAVTEAEHFVDQLPGRFQVGVVAFSTNAQVLAAPTTDRVQVKNALESLRANGGTAMGDGIERSLDFSRQANQPAAVTHDLLRAPASSSRPGASPAAPSSASGQPAANAAGSAPGRGQPGPGSPTAGGGGQSAGGSGEPAAATSVPGRSGTPPADSDSAAQVGAGQGGQQPSGVRTGAAGSAAGVGAVVTNGRPMAIVLLSDGASNEGQVTPEAAAADASQLHVPIYTIALGTPSGILDIRVGGFLRRIAVPPDPAQLQRVAQISGGRFFAAPSDRDLHAIYDNLATRIGFESQRQDVTPLFIGAATVLLLAGGVLATMWFHRFP